MTVTPKGRELIENPIGRGRVFKADRFIAEVDYNLQVFHNGSNTANPIKPVITGSLRRIDQANSPWSTELLTLHLQDKRKLDFLCVNYDPECKIASDKGFYS